MAYAINGSSASYSPQSQQWEDIITGFDHADRPIFAAAKHINLEFDQCSIALYGQWAGLHGTSMTSIEVLNMDGTSYTAYTGSNIYLALEERPSFQAGNVTGFRIKIHNVVP